MPIKGLSERRRILRLGKLRIGEKKVNAKGVEYPSGLDHFVAAVECDSKTKEPLAHSTEAVQLFHERYGPHPKEVDIKFLLNDHDKVADQWYKAFTDGRSLVCRGDGESAERLVFVRDAEQPNPPIAGPGTDEVAWVKVRCPGEQCPYMKADRCSPVLILQFSIDGVSKPGVWELSTRSYNSLVNINSDLDLIRVYTGGRIAGIPLSLQVVPKVVTPGGRKKTVHVLHVVFKGSTEDLMAYAQKSIPTVEAAALPEPDDQEAAEMLFPDEAAQQAQREAEVTVGRRVDLETGEVQAQPSQDPSNYPSPSGPEYVPGFDDPPTDKEETQERSAPGNGKGGAKGNGGVVGHDDLVKQWKDLYYRCKDHRLATPQVSCQPEDLTDGGLRSGIYFMQNSLKRAGVAP